MKTDLLDIPESERASAVISVLVVDDQTETREVCSSIIQEAGLRPREASTTEQALLILEQQPIDLAILDIRVPALGGMELLKRIREKYPEIPVMMLTQYGTIESAVEAIRLGAVDYITKPFHVDDLRSKLKQFVHSRSLDHENRVLREQLRTRPGFGGLVGVSPPMQKVYRLIEKVSRHNSPVLILGESGTGKELVARSIHFMSVRQDRAFCPVDCSSLVSTLIESELFGYVKGAFTGANASKQGLLEAANGGTLFLDEIGDMPLDLQSKLLRVLQEKEVKPVGSTERISISIRVIAATNRNLDVALRSGAFRQDLFFRLNVVQIKLPPLRERRADIPLLVNTFLDKFSEQDSRPVGVSEDAMVKLMAYSWPGNVRELENCMEHALTMNSGPFILVTDLPTTIQNQFGENAPEGDADALTSLAEMERRSILRALREAGGDKVVAARVLGIGKTTLYRKLKQYEGGKYQARAAGAGPDLADHAC